MSHQGDVKIADLMEILSNVEGALFGCEPWGLLHLPLLVDHLEGPIVEIGSHKGKSTIALALASKYLTSRKPLVYAIDPFADYIFAPGEYEQDFMNNIQVAGVHEYVKTIKKFSYDAYEECPQNISALFIDGDHSYEAVKHDITHYAPRVVAGGIIAFHDYKLGSNPGYENFGECTGVALAVDELCIQKDYCYLCDYTSLRLVRKLS